MEKDRKFVCEICGKESTISPHQAGQKYCSYKCRKIAVKRSWGWKEEKNYSHLCPGTIGALQELRVGADLLIRGWEAYRALSPNSSCDLLALKNGKLIRIEVRTGYRRKDGILNYNKARIKAEYTAIGLPDNEIIYIPELPDN